MAEKSAAHDITLEQIRIRQNLAADRAEEAFRSAESDGNWSGWVATDADPICPWWKAGADYLWEVLRAQTLIKLALAEREETPDMIRAHWKIRAYWNEMLPVVALSRWDWFRPYEPDPNEMVGQFTELNKPTARQVAFVKYASGKLFPRLASLLVRPGATEESAQIESALPATPCIRNPLDRRVAVDAFLARCNENRSPKVHRTHIWQAAGHTDPRQFQYWQAGEDRLPGQRRGATRADEQNFRTILSMKPEDFLAFLMKKQLLPAQP